jgi:hypothetical protein
LGEDALNLEKFFFQGNDKKQIKEAFGDWV